MRSSTISVLRVLTVVGASFLLLAKANGNDDDPPSQTTTYKVTLGTLADSRCRQTLELLSWLQTGFTRLQLRYHPVKDLYCSGQFEETPETQSDTTSKTFASGTYAFQRVDDAEAPDCTAVVDEWKKSYSNFDGLPPSRKANEELYENQDNVSFVAMYNPSEDATADCRVVTCTKTTAPASPPAAKQGNDGSNAEGTETKGSAIICLTAPDVLPKSSESAPFTEDQWRQIAAALEGSASVVLPSAISLAVAVLGAVAAI
ncbi:SAG family member [Eimeria mitis]|uniref:SAG family member n=1 Tax=Eimeria mitis TaxID=44415 RepID=U6JW38_9EIME|nr:SAG family member [Eimeria mitis]CDJ27733.1 SAG family member [Eimeria mitis]